MAVFSAIPFATFLLENNYFVAFYERGLHFANNFGSFDGRSAHLDGTVGINEENAVEFNCLTFFNLLAEIVYIQVTALFGFELLSLNFYDNVHFWLYINKLTRRAEPFLRLS